MKKFENAYLKFLEKYKNEEWYEGAILCGSYATGNNDANSDIDVFIVSSDSEDWRERGNCLVNGFMIEYFINPIRQVKKEINSENNSFERHTSNMFAQAVIIDDINGNIKNLIGLAKETLKTELMINDYMYQINCYSVWERFDEVESKFIKGEDIDLSFYFFMQCAIKTIAYNKGIGSFNINKIEKFLNNESYRKKYGIKKFFDKKDSLIIIKCLEEKDKEHKYNNAKTLYQHICKEFNFDIKKFSFRSKI